MNKRSRTILTLLLLIAAAFAAWHFFTSQAGAHIEAAGGEPMSVAVVAVTRGDLVKTIRLTADFRPYQEVDIHAKVAGFVQSIPVDIGDQVKEGSVIATLEIPELQEDLKKAAAGLEAAKDGVTQAEATYQGVHDVFTRLRQVAGEHPKLVAQQDLDDARAKDQAAEAGLASARQHVVEALAEQTRENALVEYSRITAPFDGVVTRRFADVGALIQAGTSSSTQGTAVVRFAQENVLRTMFPVPESAVSAVRAGVPVRIEVSGLDRPVRGTVTRFSRSLNPGTRTMETEVDIPNTDLAITPGMYGWAEMALQQRKQVLNVPVEAISAGDTPTVLLVGRDGKVEERPVKIGLETANRVEITDGLAENDLVFIGNRARLRAGETVKPQILREQSMEAANNG